MTFALSSIPHSLSHPNLHLGVHPFSGSVQWPLPRGPMPPPPPLTSIMIFDLATALVPLHSPPSTCLWCHTTQAGCPGQGSPQLAVHWAKGPLNCDCQGHLWSVRVNVCFLEACLKCGHVSGGGDWGSSPCHSPITC